MSTQIEPLLTIADLDAMPDDGNRYEIIDGELFVSRSPSLTHYAPLETSLCESAIPSQKIPLVKYLRHQE